MARLARHASPQLLALLLASMAGPRVSRAQHVSRTDDVTQRALVETGLAAETICPTSRPSLTPLGSDVIPPVSLAPEVAGVVVRRPLASGDEGWIGYAVGGLRAHGRHTGCHVDWRARGLGTSRGDVGGDATFVLSAPGALDGALHLFAEGSAAGDVAAGETLSTPEHVEIGGAYTTFDLYRALLPCLYRFAAFDVRARLSAGASFAYGRLRKLRDQSAVADVGATVVGKVEEKAHGGLLYTFHVVPDYYTGRRLVEHTTALTYGFRPDRPATAAWLLRRSPYLLARYSLLHLTGERSRPELGLASGFTLF